MAESAITPLAALGGWHPQPLVVRALEQDVSQLSDTRSQAVASTKWGALLLVALTSVGGLTVPSEQCRAQVQASAWCVSEMTPWLREMEDAGVPGVLVLVLALLSQTANIMHGKAASLIVCPVCLRSSCRE